MPIMMSNRTCLFLRQFYKRSSRNCRFCSSISERARLADPTPLFFHSNVQKLLKILTRINYEAVHRPCEMGKYLKNSLFRFMTDAEVEEAKQKSIRRTNYYLQMPPVVKPQVDTLEVLSTDPDLQGYEESKLVFTDITYGISSKNRLIVVREPNGTLRHAHRKESIRLQQVYTPVEGRELEVPKMFEEQYFRNLLARQEYKFILDRACIQFDPDDPQYHSITKHVYSTVDLRKDYNHLRSTRHFGPMAFYIACEREIDNLLLDVINDQKLNEAAALILLYHIIHPEAKSAKVKCVEDTIEFIRTYAKLDSKCTQEIEAAIEAYCNMEKEKKELAEGIKKAHGLDTSCDQPEMEIS